MIQLPEENEKSKPFSHRKKVRIFLVWWARVDSNHRSIKQQIYSLSPLATREHALIHFSRRYLAGRLVYFTTGFAVCQQLFFIFFALPDGRWLSVDCLLIVASSAAFVNRKFCADGYFGAAGQNF